MLVATVLWLTEIHCSRFSFIRCRRNLLSWPLIPEIFLYPKSVRPKVLTFLYGSYSGTSQRDDCPRHGIYRRTGTGTSGYKPLENACKRLHRKSLSHYTGCHTSPASDLHLRNLLQHDLLFRTGIPRAGCLCQDYRNHLPSVYFPADIPILHRRNVRRQEPVPPVRKNDAGLLYGISTQSSAATIPVTRNRLYKTEWMKVSPDLSSLCVPPSICPEVPWRLWPVPWPWWWCRIFPRFPDVRRIHLHVRVTMVAALGVPGGAIMASAWYPVVHAGIRWECTGTDDCSLHCHGQFRHSLQCNWDGALALLIDKWFGSRRRIFPVHSPKLTVILFPQFIWLTKTEVALSHVQGL